MAHQSSPIETAIPRERSTRPAREQRPGQIGAPSRPTTSRRRQISTGVGSETNARVTLSTLRKVQDNARRRSERVLQDYRAQATAGGLMDRKLVALKGKTAQILAGRAQRDADASRGGYEAAFRSMVDFYRRQKDAWQALVPRRNKPVRNMAYHRELDAQGGPRRDEATGQQHPQRQRALTIAQAELDRAERNAIPFPGRNSVQYLERWKARKRLRDVQKAGRGERVGASRVGSRRRPDAQNPGHGYLAMRAKEAALKWLKKMQHTTNEADLFICRQEATRLKAEAEHHEREQRKLDLGLRRPLAQADRLGPGRALPLRRPREGDRPESRAQPQTLALSGAQRQRIEQGQAHGDPSAVFRVANFEAQGGRRQRRQMDPQRQQTGVPTTPSLTAQHRQSPQWMRVLPLKRKQSVAPDGIPQPSGVRTQSLLPVHMQSLSPVHMQQEEDHPEPIRSSLHAATSQYSPIWEPDAPSHGDSGRISLASSSTSLQRRTTNQDVPRDTALASIRPQHFPIHVLDPSQRQDYPRVPLTTSSQAFQHHTTDRALLQPPPPGVHRSLFAIAAQQQRPRQDYVPPFPSSPRQMQRVVTHFQQKARQREADQSLADEQRQREHDRATTEAVAREREHQQDAHDSREAELRRQQRGEVARAVADALERERRQRRRRDRERADARRGQR